MAKKVLIQDMCEPLAGATAATIDISTGTGNLMVGRLTSDPQLLASGVLEYMDGQVPPVPSMSMGNGRATFTLKAEGGRRPSLRMPWSACNAETNWQIQLNPAITSDITARSGGGNVKLDLAGMVITRVFADSGGGNMDVVLPDNAANLDIAAKTGGGNVTVEIGSATTGSNTVSATSGAGNVVVRVPSGLSARIHASTGMGKTLVDPRFSKIDGNTYQTPDYDVAADKVEITAKSGAGNVSISAK